MAAELDHCELPKPRPLEYTTPSGAATLQECKLRAAYDSDPDFRSQVPSSPAARLGTVCHRVLELAGVGRFPSADDSDWNAAFEASWDAALEFEEQPRRSSVGESYWPPPERWPFYAVRKVATKRLCRRLSASRQGQFHEVAGVASVEVVHEQRQTAFDGRLRGRADVIRRGPEPEIEDYKTGSLYESDANEIKARYRTQMLLYAVLEHATSGVWPRRATLVPLEGEPATIEVDPSDATSAAQAALDALADYNSAIKNHTTFIELANPSPHACRFCPYAISCPAFWHDANDSWADAGVIAVSGSIGARELSRESTFSIEVIVAAGSLAREICRLYKLDVARFKPALEAPIGTEIAAVWLAGDVKARQLRPTARTRFAVAKPRA